MKMQPSIASCDVLFRHAPSAAPARSSPRGVFAVPQFVPQLRIALTEQDISGVSWTWAALTSVNNAAWCAYFVRSHYWTALIPGGAVTLVAGALAAQLAKRGKASSAGATLIVAWTAVVASVGLAYGRAPLGALLTGAFVLQVSPSLWRAYRTRHPAGISRGTWLLILAELTCWGLYGIRSSDPRLITLGSLGVIASTLMLMRVGSTAVTGAEAVAALPSGGERRS